jgi:hypothetical protein
MRISKKEKRINELRNAEEKWILERSLRLKKYQAIFKEEYLPLRSTVSIRFFDEIMYDYVYGAYVSCIVLCHLVCMEVLKSPFNSGSERNIFEYGFSKLLEENKNRGWIEDDLSNDLLKLNRIGNKFEHSKDSRKIIKDLDQGKNELGKLYDPNSYEYLERKVVFAMKLVHRVIFDTRLMFAPAKDSVDDLQ